MDLSGLRLLLATHQRLGERLTLMKKLSHGFDIRERDGGGVELHMTIALAQAQA